MSSVSQMDAPLLERALRRGHARLGLVDFLDEIVDPLLHQIGSLWQEGEVRVAEEHLVTGVVRDFLSTLAELRTHPLFFRPHFSYICVSCYVVAMPQEAHPIGAVMEFHDAPMTRCVAS